MTRQTFSSRWTLPIFMVLTLMGVTHPALAQDLSEALDDAATAEEEEKIEVIRERYENRAIKIEREVTQDAEKNYINHGSWKMWDETGTLITEGHYLFGERDGVWTRWYRRGPLFTTAPYNQFEGPYVSQAKFQEGKLDGEWTIYDSKQRKISLIEFAYGLRHGKATWWYPTGRTMREVEYRDGLIDGKLMEWDVDGTELTSDTYQAGRKLASKVEYHMSEGTRTSRGRTRTSTSQKKSVGVYLHAKLVVETPDDWWDARFATYTTEGSDERHGVWASWYPSGQPQMSGSYENDVEVGKFTWWYANGQKALEGNYEDGKPHGTWTWWHDNGQKSTEGEYANGSPTGPWTWWQDDGKVVQSADFSNAQEQVVDAPLTLPYEVKLPEPETASEPRGTRR